MSLFDPEAFEILYSSIEKDYYKKQPKVDKEVFIWLGLHRIRPNELEREVENLEKLSEFGEEVKKKEVYKILKEFLNQF